ncbi:hypothetical protein PCE1_003779 [Barthelona sp. PCE]
MSDTTKSRSRTENAYYMGSSTAAKETITDDTYKVLTDKHRKEGGPFCWNCKQRGHYSYQCSSEYLNIPNTIRDRALKDMTSDSKEIDPALEEDSTPATDFDAKITAPVKSIESMPEPWAM